VSQAVVWVEVLSKASCGIVDGATVSTREFPRWQVKPMRLAAVVGRLALQGNVHVTSLLTQPCAAVPQTAGYVAIYAIASYLFGSCACTSA
jgi:hypothetical protein